MDNQAERMYQLMRVESNRLKTFQMNPPWPKDYVDIKKLAKAGFFYAFNGDNVHCAFCRGQVCRWDRDDDPMSEHARHFTTCPFIMGSDVGNEPLGEDPFPGPKRPRPYDVCGMMFPTFPPNDPRSQQEQLERQQHSQDVQFQHGASHLFEQYQYDYGRSNGQNEQTTANANVQQQQQQQQASDEANHTPPYDDENNTTSTTGTTEEILDHQARHSLSSNSSNCSSSSTSLTGICKICYSNPIELLFLPCQHSVSCLSCAQRLHSCPCCRAFIRTKIRSFLV